MSRCLIVTLLLIAAGLAACGGGPVPASEFAVRDFGAASQQQRSHCGDYNSLKNAYFGDLHVHTSVSNDAWSFGVRVAPEQAYDYAFGGTVNLPPNDAEGVGTRSVSIDRPLDFMAVTDHAEFLGEQVLCSDPESGVANAGFCEAFADGEGRNPKLLAKIASPFPQRDEDVCGEDGSRCAKAAQGVWQANIAAAEKWNDTSDACARTAFIGFEYSSHRLGSNLHRNVIFRNSVVPERPISFLDAPREWRLWEILKQECLDSDRGCDTLAIPHNSNISNGRMFAVDYPGVSSEQDQAARAALRIAVEPVIEIMQHKGDSECRNGLDGVLGGEDELCGFEKFEDLAFSTINEGGEVEPCYSGPLADYVPHKGPNCLSRLSYVRYALVEGMREEERIGVNPFKFGLSASTDTHNGTGGGVLEKNFAGHLGWGDASSEQRVRYDNSIPGNASNSPGGLIGVWSEQNTRASLFDAIKRKEVFGTSGPRITPRFFGGWDYPSDLCGDAQLVAKAYAGGVSMGNDLPSKPDAVNAPRFIAIALGDSGTALNPGVPLQRLQVVKGWFDEKGNHYQRIFDVAGNGDNGATVDPDSCEPRGQGYKQLCSVWRDPEFEHDQRAVYYMRAVENPSCRYNAWQCLAMPFEQRPADCESKIVPKVLQERAWTSPIWYTPGA